MTSPKDDIHGFFNDLAREEQQEQEVNTHRGSFFETAPPSGVIVERAREFDDVEKQIVRREQWLSILTKLRSEKEAGLRLLTLPGKYRLEVELYLRSGLLERHHVGHEEIIGVVGYETDPSTFGQLRLDKPAFEMLENADLTKALTDMASPAYRALARRFPFDVINLDFTVPLATPSNGPYSQQLRAIHSTMVLQGAQATSWALLITFRSQLAETSGETLREWSEAVDDNIRRHPHIRDAFREKFNVHSARGLVERLGDLSIGELAIKWILDQAHMLGWKLRDVSEAWYSRNAGQYFITKLMFIFARPLSASPYLPKKKLEEVGWHVDDVVAAVKECKRTDVSAKVQKLKEANSKYLDIVAAELESLKLRPTIDSDPQSEL